MKKIRVASLLICIILLLGSFCIGANAQEEEFVINSKEIYMVIPKEYAFCPFDLSSTYYSFVDEQGNNICVECVPNTYDLTVSKDFTEEKVKELASLHYFAEGNEDVLRDMEISFSEFSTEKVNGFSVFLLEGAVGNTEASSITSFGVCLMATQESVYFVGLQNHTEKFSKKEELLLLIGNVKINGTFLSGDSPTYVSVFSDMPFKTAVKADVEKSFSDFNKHVHNLDAEENDRLTAEELEEIIDIVLLIVCSVTGLPALFLFIGAVWLIRKHVKYTKLIKKYEEGSSSNPFNNK